MVKLNGQPKSRRKSLAYPGKFHEGEKEYFQVFRNAICEDVEGIHKIKIESRLDDLEKRVNCIEWFIEGLRMRRDHDK